MKNAREILLSYWRGETINPNIISFFQGITSRTVTESANDTLRYLKEQPYPYKTSPISSFKLAEKSTIFHERANTLSKSVIKNIDCIKSGSPRIRLSHQIDIFFSMGILGQFILLNQIQQKLSQHGVPTGSIYVAIDYDRAEDSRFRVAHFPDVKRRDGFIPLTGAVKKELFNKPMGSIPKPPAELVKSWLFMIQSSINENISILRKMNVFEQKRNMINNHFCELQDIIWESYSKANSFTDFNAFLISKIVNNMWNLPIAFVYGSELQPLMKDGYEQLFDRYDLINSFAKEAKDYFANYGVHLKGITEGNTSKFLLWYNCPKCFERLELKLTEGQNIFVESTCPDCQSKYKFQLGTRLKPELSAISDRMSARIILDNILDTASLGFVGGSGYIGQADHLVLTNYVAKKLGMSISPQCIFIPNGLYGDIVTCRATNILTEYESNISLLNPSYIKAIRYVFSSKATFLYFVINFGIKKLFDLWSLHYYDNVNKQAVDTDNYSPYSISVINADVLTKNLI